MIERIKDLAKQVVSRSTETVHDFLGVVELDAELSIIVLPDHVAAVIDLGGTDYAYSSEANKRSILFAWGAVLNDARMNIQLFVDRRPIRYNQPGGYLDGLAAQVPTGVGADPWCARRLQQHRNDVLRGDLELWSIPISEVRHYAVIRYASGGATSRPVEGESAAYLPPPEQWRFWEKATYRFGGRNGVKKWRAARRREAALLDREVERFMRDANKVPGFAPRRLTGLELTQFMHLLWRGDAARDEWIADEAMLHDISSGNDVLAEEVA